MNTLQYIFHKFKLNPATLPPIKIPNVGRNDLALWLRELDFKTGVEVGVAAGIYSEILCQANPQIRIWGIDPWARYRDYPDYGQETLTKLEKEAITRLSKFPNYRLIKKYSLEALKDFSDESLDFVYIDANHRDPYVSQDIEGWSKKVKRGGIISGHDYVRKKRLHIDVKRAVTKYAFDHKINPWFILGADAKIPGTVRDSNRSWMWVKI